MEWEYNVIITCCNNEGKILNKINLVSLNQLFSYSSFSNPFSSLLGKMIPVLSLYIWSSKQHYVIHVRRSEKFLPISECDFMWKQCHEYVKSMLSQVDNI